MPSYTFRSLLPAPDYFDPANDHVDFAFIDARKLLGHMIEIYPRSDGVVGFYRHVREASVSWSGEDPLRSV